MTSPERILFITGKLAEPALQRTLTELAPRANFTFEIAIMPITVAALLTTEWIAKRLIVPNSIDRILLPGLCRGELKVLEELTGKAIQLGPKDLRDLPEFFSKQSPVNVDYGRSDIAIVAEINHAPQKSLAEILALAEHYRASGADIIDLGCDPGSTWNAVPDATKMLIDHGFRVSVDSFNPDEVMAALSAGAELVLSVNASNREDALRWHEQFEHVEVVAIPDSPAELETLFTTAEYLTKHNIRHRLDPIVEPIGFGFAASLGRYIETRRRFPEAEIMMGIGNLTELTDADSAGMNVLLAGFCQELGIRSVLTTEVINWARSSVKEFDLARKLVHHAVVNKTLPKKIEPKLILLRDPKLHIQGEQTLQELADAITDRNYRIFAERGELHIMNGDFYIRGTNPFQLFAEMQQRDAKLDASHSFYLGYELAKAVTALTLSKNYTQDRELQWGFLTVPEFVTHG